MGLFSSSVASITVDYYGQKRRNKVISSIQTYYNVTIAPPISDPLQLADLYAKTFISIEKVTTYMPAVHEVFWAYTNGGFQRLDLNPPSLLFEWQGFADIAPIQGMPSGKPNTTVKNDLMDNGKMKYKISENAVGTYYNAIAPVAILQTIREQLSSDSFAVFYQRVRELLMAEQGQSKKVGFQTFNLEPMPELVTDTSASRASTAIGYCGKCGEQLELVDGGHPAFCGSCGNPL